MKVLLYVAIFSLLLTNVSAQDVSGKWYGKLTQGPGAYSELYDFDLNLNQARTITGESYAAIGTKLNVRIGLSGMVRGDSIVLQESKSQIREEIIPYGWVLCIKTVTVAYSKQGTREYLRGTWKGVSKEDSDDACIPGEIILARTKEDLQLFLDKGGFQTPAPLEPVIKPIAAFTPEFNNTAVNKVTEIEVHNRNLQIQLSDYLNVDNDTVSVYLNRNVLAKNVWISRRPVKVDFKIESSVALNEILLFAENLGKIPPNTSLMLIIDGNRTHRIRIESDKQKTAAIYLRYNIK